MYKLTLLIKPYFITSYLLTNLKILFCYLLDIYCNELKFIYSNDIIFKRINLNIT